MLEASDEREERAEEIVNPLGVAISDAMLVIGTFVKGHTAHGRGRESAAAP